MLKITFGKCLNTYFYRVFFCISAEMYVCGHAGNGAINFGGTKYWQYFYPTLASSLSLSSPNFYHSQRMVYEVINYFVIRIVHLNALIPSKPYVFIIRNEVNPLRQQHTYQIKNCHQYFSEITHA